MIRYRGRVFFQSQMFYDNMAARFMVEQAAFDFGMIAAAGIEAVDWRGKGAKFMDWTTRLDNLLSSEVYTGDVVELRNGASDLMHGLVRWKKDECCFVVTQYVGINQYNFHFNDRMWLHVVGNIYEHSDFMENVRRGGLKELPADLAALREQI